MAKRLGKEEVFRNDKRMLPQNSSGHRAKHPSKCPECGLLFQDGVWKREAARIARELESRLCPACLQIRDGRAGGEVRLEGSFIQRHRQDLMNRIRNVENQTIEERPLERIISIKEKNGEIVVSATTEHLIARIGKAIQRDFGGNLELKYAPEEKFAMVRWYRDN